MLFGSSRITALESAPAWRQFPWPKAANPALSDCVGLTDDVEPQPAKTAARTRTRTPDATARCRRSPVAVLQADRVVDLSLPAEPTMIDASPRLAERAEFARAPLSLRAASGFRPRSAGASRRSAGPPIANQMVDEGERAGSHLRSKLLPIVDGVDVPRTCRPRTARRPLRDPPATTDGEVMARNLVAAHSGWRSALATTDGAQRLGPRSAPHGEERQPRGRSRLAQRR